MAGFFKIIEGKELTNEKIRDFKRTVAAQGAIILSLFLLEFFEFLNFPYHLEVAETLFFMALGVYVYLLWDMLRNYTSSKRLIVLNFVLIMGVFLFGFVGVNPFFPMPPILGYRIFLGFVQVCLLAVECSVIYFTIMEFFKKDLGMPIKLWGAACIYIMIGLAFGSVYEILCVMDVDCLGVEIPLRTVALMKRISFSLSVLSGMDSPFGNAASMIFTMGTIEALWGQVFIVLIVGRLMMK